MEPIPHADRPCDRERRGKRGWRWFTSLTHCPSCHKLLQIDGYGNSFCLSCGYANSEEAKVGLSFMRRQSHDFMLDPDKEYKLDLDIDLG